MSVSLTRYQAGFGTFSSSSHLIFLFSLLSSLISSHTETDTIHRIKRELSICQSSLCQNLVSFPVLNRIKPQAPLLAVPFRRTTQGLAQRSTESRETYQIVNPDCFYFSKGAKEFIKLTTPLGKRLACDVVRLCFVVCVCLLCVCVSVVCVCCV